MFRVAYKSTLAGGVGDAEIRAIADGSARRHEPLGVKGVWLLSGRRCLSALEGDPRVVRGIIETIWDDQRHTDFELLDMDTSDISLFDWPFRLVRDADLANEETLTAHEGLQWLGAFDGGLNAFFGEREDHSPDSKKD